MRYIFLYFFIFQIGYAQTLSSNLDKTNIELGEPILMKIYIRDLQGKEVISAQKKGLLPFHFEEIKDEIEQSSNQYTRSIEFSIFDEGSFTLPPLEFKIGDSIYKTIPYVITVSNSAKANEEINDIHPNQEVELKFSDYWELYQNYFWGILFFSILVVILFIFIKHRKNKPILNKNTPYNALLELEKLNSKNYIAHGNHRQFYIEILEICREVLEEKYHIPAKILLTDDLIDYIKREYSIELENQKVLESIFHRGDLVKFAKIIPQQEVMEKDFQLIKNWITSISTKTQND